ncbi:PIN domain-containing protein [Janthinobacterium sp. 78]|uniref:PIN domain-containing protein n=1 Tax=Janthinobacterium sp. 78 TaxID=2135631 RepID=UPI000D5E8D27|nr:PIN domain-containing protein [Janthinobacterium sp. 78]PVX36356.1 hypothetical protein C8C92_2973 [Janthinobacterium sp. 78]
MPKGLPTASELIEHRKVKFFSIDTDIIQSLGYKFEDGALLALHLQRPKWIAICLTEVVQREVMNHRMEPISQALNDLGSALNKVKRLCSHELKVSEREIKEAKLEDVLREKFENEFAEFVKRLDGVVLKLDGADLARRMFDKYFSLQAPFESRKEKKSEFPDAAALLILEDFAREKNSHGIIISKDSGWLNFSNQSDFLYCVRSLEEFVALFESKSESADKVKEKVKNSLLDKTSDVYSQLENVIARHLGNASWRMGDIYSSYNLRVEGEVNAVNVEDSHFNHDEVGLWFVEHDPSLCTVELNISVEVSLDVNVEFYQYDTIDHDEFNVGSVEVQRSVEVDVEVFLICKGQLLDDPMEEWSIDFGVSGGDCTVDVGDVQPKFDSDYDD